MKTKAKTTKGFKVLYTIKSKTSTPSGLNLWNKHGVVIETPEGNIRIILNSIPVSTGDALSLYCFEPKNEREG